MNVVHIGIHYNPARGGGNLRNSRLIEEFSGLSSDNKIFIISYDYNIKFTNSLSNVQVFMANNVLVQIMYLIRLCLKYKIDVVHCHNPRLFFFSSFLPIKSKLILELHSFQKLSGFKEKMFRSSIKNADDIFVLGKYGKELLMKEYALPNDKITIVPNGFTNVDTTFEATKKKGGIVKTVAYIGSFYEWQGVYNYVEAVKLFTEKYGNTDAGFLMVGGGQEYENVRNLVSKYKLEEVITFTGQVAPHKINEYWELTDILVIPRPSTQATESTVPLKIMEAFSYGKLIIGSNVKGITEHVTDGYNGLLYQHENISELADLMHLALTEGELYRKLSQNSLEYCRKLKSWNEVANFVLNKYIE